ncbi:MAG: hypothetical protein NXI24_20055 [bacterium]|nr:hypothetical protein [bacterium]
MVVTGLEISSSLKLNPVRLAKPALELIRSMVGREIRATVVRGAGAEGGLIQLRSGGTLIEARATGAPLRAGQHLFLKVEQPQQGTYRLVVLDPRQPAGGPAIAAKLLQSLPPGPLQQLFSAFLRHYTQAGKTKAAPSGSPGGTLDAAGLKQAGKSGLVSGPAGAPGGAMTGRTGGASEGVPRSILDSFSQLTARVPDLDRSALAPILQGLLQSPGGEQAPDFWLGQGWGPSAADDEGDEPLAEDYAAFVGRLAEAPFYFMSDFKLAATGRIGVLVLSPDPDFRRLSLYLHPERADTADWLESRALWLKEQVGQAVQWERLEVIRATEAGQDVGGGLLDLQG